MPPLKKYVTCAYFSVSPCAGCAGRLRQHVRQHVVHGFGQNHHRQGEQLVVLRHADVVQSLRHLRRGDHLVLIFGPGQALALIFRQPAIPCQHARNLAHAIGAIVEANARIFISHRAHRFPRVIHHHKRLHELVRHSVVVALLHPCDGVGISAALGLARLIRHGIEGLLLPLPSPVSIHGEVAAADAGNFAHANFVDFALQFFEIPGAAGGQRVAAIEECVDNTRSTPCCFAASNRACKCSCCECTPPSETRPSKCSARPFSPACFSAATITGWRKNSPDRIRSSMRVISMHHAP